MRSLVLLGLRVYDNAAPLCCLQLLKFHPDKVKAAEGTECAERMSVLINVCAAYLRTVCAKQPRDHEDL